MFASVGLAAVPGGYDAGAVDYWKRKEAEENHAALTALGNFAMAGIPGSLMSNAPATPAPPIAPPQGVGAPGAAPMPARPAPPSPAASPPGAGPATGPVMQGGPPGMLPGAPQGSPPPGFTNPLSVGGQPQNLTGPLIPPGGAGPAPGPAGSPGPAQQPQMPPQVAGAARNVVQSLGPPPPGGYDWRAVVAQLAQANPGASPAVIARAALMMAPLMNQQAQQELKMLNLMLAQERVNQGQQRVDQGEERIAQQRTNELDREANRAALNDIRERELQRRENALTEAERHHKETETAAGTRQEETAQHHRATESTATGRLQEQQRAAGVREQAAAGRAEETARHHRETEGEADRRLGEQNRSSVARETRQDRALGLRETRDNAAINAQRKRGEQADYRAVQRDREAAERAYKATGDLKQRERALDLREQELQLREQGMQQRDQRAGAAATEKQREFDIKSGQTERKLGQGDRGLDLRQQRQETLAGQARARLDLQTQKFLDAKQARVDKAKQQAEALAATNNRAQQRNALNEWNIALQDYHRSVREKIGAQGIIDKKAKAALMADLDEQEAADKAALQEAEKNYKKGRTTDESGTPEERGTAATKLGEGLRAKAAKEKGRPIPQAQLPAIQQMIQQHGRDAVVKGLQEQGFATEGL